MKTYTPLPVPKDSAWERKKTWKYYTPIWFNKFVEGIQNIITWIPIIYKNKNWDWRYIYDILEFKLLQQRKYLVNANRHTSIPETNKHITTCLNLIQRVKEEYYSCEYFDYHEMNFEFLPIEDKDAYTLESTLVWEKYDEYLSKYPLQVKKILKKYPEFKDDKYRLCMCVGRENEERAQLLLFKIMNEKMRGWWD
jgi:hypothetical protein